MRRSLIYKIDRLVRKITVRNIPFAETCSSFGKCIRDQYAVIPFVIPLDPTKYTDRVSDRGLGYRNRLESTFECRILFYIFAVLGHGGGTDHLDLAA